MNAHAASVGSGDQWQSCGRRVLRSTSDDEHADRPATVHSRLLYTLQRDGDAFVAGIASPRTCTRRVPAQLRKTSLEAVQHKIAALVAVLVAHARQRDVGVKGDELCSPCSEVLQLSCAQRASRQTTDTQSRPREG